MHLFKMHAFSASKSQTFFNTEFQAHEPFEDFKGFFEEKKDPLCLYFVRPPSS